MPGVNILGQCTALIPSPNNYAITIVIACSINNSTTQTGPPSTTETSSLTGNGTITLTQVPFINGYSEFTGSNQFSVQGSCCGASDVFYFSGPSADASSITGTATYTGFGTAESITAPCSSSIASVCTCGLADLIGPATGGYDINVLSDITIPSLMGGSGDCLDGVDISICTPPDTSAAPVCDHTAQVYGSVTFSASDLIGSHELTQGYDVSYSYSGYGAYSISQTGSMSVTVNIARA